MNGYNCSCVAGYTGKNCSVGKRFNCRVVKFVALLNVVLKGRISGKRLSNEHNQHRKYQLLKGFVFLNLVLVYSVMNVSCLS